ncbi:hypothetical protein JW905_10040, partial [bacterium]|nr:hypothetical protein [candidate division CSSED10-310 bacterium]
MKTWQSFTPAFTACRRLLACPGSWRRLARLGAILLIVFSCWVPGVRELHWLLSGTPAQDIDAALAAVQDAVFQFVFPHSFDQSPP